MSKIICIIPARYQASRFPGKVLALLWGKPIIQHVYERASLATAIDEVWVAADHPKIVDTVKGFGGKVVLTSTEHCSGTDRIAEAARKIEGDIIINVQGDEPLLSPDLINTLALCLQQDDTISMGTLACTLDPTDIDNPNAVKVVMDCHGDALIFSRYPVPFCRDGATETVKRYRHIGIYAYRRDYLFEFVAQPVSFLEQTEKLEQLRALEAGTKIRVLPVSFSGHGVDTPEDLVRIKKSRRASE